MYSLDNRINVIFCVSGTLCSSSLSKCVAAIGRDVNSSHLAVDISNTVTVTQYLLKNVTNAQTLRKEQETKQNIIMYMYVEKKMSK